jgi:transposase-like protein
VNRSGFPGGPNFWKDGVHGNQEDDEAVPAELRERAVRLVREQAAEHGSQWSAIRSIAEKVGCNAETLRLWVRRSERDRGSWPGLTTDERDRLKALERENRELRQANEILRKASAYFAQAELDRRFKP